jgi:YidC/Oxa1 family membrane protein insertase
MMDWQRSGLIAGMVLVLGFLFIQWNEFRDARKPPAVETGQELLVVPGKEQHQAEITEPSAIPVLEKAASPLKIDRGQTVDARLITVTTDVLEVIIDALGGDIVRVGLLNYPLSQADNSEPFIILNRTRKHTYIAQSGLIGQNGTDRQGERPLYSVSQDSFDLRDGEDQLVVALSLEDGGVSITKQFVFRPGDYLIDVNYRINNNTENTWLAHLFGQIQRDTYNPNTVNAMGPRAYLGMAINTEEDNYKKLDFDDLSDKTFKTAKIGGWVAMVQHYFVVAWVPDQQQKNQYQLRKLGNSDLYAAGFTGPALKVDAGGEGSTGTQIYVGPKDQHRLASISPYLDLTIDYGWLWWVAKPLFAGLDLINKMLNNWGWSILVLTVIVKLLFFPLSAASYRSMARMRKLQPEMLRLRELYGDDRQKLSQETMGLYKKEKVNPVGGCFPMLIQMPVFIALYWVLNESVELRQAPWILWITDLSVKDPYYVLPILNGLSMFALQTLQPAPPDPIQAKVMKIMPVAFSFFFMFFPAGLVLYWTANSVLSIAQQWTITKKIIGEQ